MSVVLLFTCLLFTFNCFGLLLGICPGQYDQLCWSHCYLLVSYLLLTVLAFYLVFVPIYTTSFAGRYLSFSFNHFACVAVVLLLCCCLRSFRLVALVGLAFLAAYSLLFALVLLCVTLRCDVLVWSLLSCFVLYVFSTMYLGLLILFAGFHDWSYSF